MQDETRCRVTKNHRACGLPAVVVRKVPDLGRVPMCAACHADVQARLDVRIAGWAKQLAAGASLDDLH